MNKWILCSLVFVSSFASANETDLFSSFKEGLYGTKSYACGRTVVINHSKRKIYLELAENPVHGYDCDSISVPVAEATCPDSTGQGCRISNSSSLDLLSDSMFVLHSPNGEKLIFRWVSE